MRALWAALAVVCASAAARAAGDGVSAKTASAPTAPIAVPVTGAALGPLDAAASGPPPAQAVDAQPLPALQPSPELRAAQAEPDAAPAPAPAGERSDDALGADLGDGAARFDGSKPERPLSDYAALPPEDLIRELERDPRLASLFSKSVGVHEGYTLRRHTLMVLGQFDRYVAPTLPPGTDLALFRAMLALHDAGKPLAVEAGDKGRQHEFTVPLLREHLGRLGFSPRQVELAVALVDADPIGPLLAIRPAWAGPGPQPVVGPETLARSVAQVRRIVERTGRPAHEVLRLLLAFYFSDAASYTKDAGGQEALDRLWVFDRAARELHLAPESAARLQPLLARFAAPAPAQTAVRHSDFEPRPFNEGSQGWAVRSKDGAAVLKVFKFYSEKRYVEEVARWNDALIAAGIPAVKMTPARVLGSPNPNDTRLYGLTMPFVEGARLSDILYARPWWKDRPRKRRLKKEAAAIRERVRAILPEGMEDAHENDFIVTPDGRLVLIDPIDIRAIPKSLGRR